MLQLLPDFIWFEHVVLPILGMCMGGGVLFGIYRTVNRHADRKHELQMASTTGTGGGRELEDLRARVELLEESTFRVQELEERLDFAERLLTQQQQQPKIDPGQGS